MDTHTAAAAGSHVADSGHSSGEHAVLDDNLRFEKSELHEFLEDDRSAGEHVGILLAVVFCISLALMLGVTYWTSQNHGVGNDPHFIRGADEAAHH